MTRSFQNFWTAPLVSSSQNVVTVSGSITVQEAVEIMNRQNIGCLLVQDGKRYGLVSERDVVKEYAFERFEFDEKRSSEIMSVGLITITATANGKPLPDG
ncbi:MAG: CBS domain-containing protein [Deltaproteobacteria bacterium]|nr:CBS domain-containing protein [Deltaproteobacteria bacterium]